MEEEREPISLKNWTCGQCNAIYCAFINEPMVCLKTGETICEICVGRNKCYANDTRLFVTNKTLHRNLPLYEGTIKAMEQEGLPEKIEFLKFWRCGNQCQATVNIQKCICWIPLERLAKFKHMIWRLTDNMKNISLSKGTLTTRCRRVRWCDEEQKQKLMELSCFEHPI